MPLFYSFFKSLVGKEVIVELKNDLRSAPHPLYLLGWIVSCLISFLHSIQGTLHSVDQYLNIKLMEITIPDPDKYPHMLSVKNCFIRGSTVRYIQLPADEVDTALLQDATRKEGKGQ
jgi:U6 snRNA-associated Sm-like protein LSm2